MDIEKLDIPLSQDPKYASWLKDCYTYSKKSNHPSTHNAALLLANDEMVLWGVNILPPGVKEVKERFEGPNKHIYLNHAERDVLYKAARKGIATEGLTMVMPWLPCIPCANAVITSGISRLIVHRQMIERTDPKWKDELEDAVQIMKEAGIEMVAYDGVVGAKVYQHSKEWDA